MSSLRSGAFSPEKDCRMVEEGRYLGYGFKILDMDSFVVGHLCFGRHFLRRRIAAALFSPSPDGDSCGGGDGDGDRSGEGCRRVNVAERRTTSSAARPLRRGLR